jgi:Sodium/hydrogen exchanger family
VYALRLNQHGVQLFTDHARRTFASGDTGAKAAFIGVSLVALALSRAANVYPITALANALTPPGHRKIPAEHTHMLWFSGLRGAMSFALANLARDSMSGTAWQPVGDLIFTTTFVTVFATVIANGGYSYYLIMHLRLHGDGSDYVSGGTAAAADALDPDTPRALIDGDTALDVGSPSASAASTSRGLLDGIHDYQRQGGLMRQLEDVDKKVSEWLVPHGHLAVSAHGGTPRRTPPSDANPLNRLGSGRSRGTGADGASPPRGA